MSEYNVDSLVGLIIIAFLELFFHFMNNDSITKFAYAMLEPITYLHAALDIPYCHHENWDGTGYPRGLKDYSIPVSA